jgi:arylsulfatase A-like enzyme
MRYAVAALLLALGASPAWAQQESPYDVLFIAVDDLNDWVGYLGGHPQAQTPNIDRLAARGMAFLNAQSPSAICHAVRTAVLTGLRPSTTGIYGNRPDWRDQEIFQGKMTIPRYFRESGYATSGAGKIFHAHTYAEYGLTGFNDTTAWNEFFPSLDRQLPDELGPMNIPANGNPYGRSFDWFGLVAEDYALGDGQVTTWVSERLRVGAGGPRFIAAGIYRPHLPWYVPESYFDRFPLDEIQLPPHFDGDLDDVPESARAGTLNSVEVHEWVVEHDRWREGVQAYLASISYADAMVGRLIDALDASGRADNTIIVLWGDHGFHLGEKGRWRKMTLWVESLHVPFIIVAPGIVEPGSQTAAPVSLMDIYPTLVELAGLESPGHLEGRSLVPLLEDPSLRWDHPTLSTYGYRNHAVVSSDYKYIRYSDGSEELYAVREDPNEWSNLAKNAEYDDVKRALSAFFPETDAPDLSPPRGDTSGESSESEAETAQSDEGASE